jgi:hypothetical protein
MFALHLLLLSYNPISSALYSVAVSDYHELLVNTKDLEFTL